MLREISGDIRPEVGHSRNPILARSADILAPLPRGTFTGVSRLVSAATAFPRE